MDLEQYFHREPIADRGISVVMPACNEAESLEAAISNVSAALDNLKRGHEIIVVDDGSDDGTNDVAERITALNRRVTVIRHPNRLGYGAALRSAIHAAKYPLCLQLDSDNHYEASEIERFLATIDQVDIVCGYREPRPSRSGSRMTTWLYRSLVRFVFGVTVRDVDCGFRLFRRAALRRIPIQSNGRFAHAEILAKAAFMNMLIGDVAVTYRPRRTGSGKRPRERFRETLREAAIVFRRPHFTATAAPSGKSPTASSAA